MELESVHEMTMDDLEEAIRKARDALSLKQELFLDHYQLEENGKQAAIAAGYSAKTAESQASRMLRSVKVSLIRSLQRERIRRTRCIDMDWVIGQHLDNLRLARALNEASAVTKSLDSIAKLASLFPDPKSTLEISTKVSLVDIDEDYWDLLVADHHGLVEPKTKH